MAAVLPSAKFRPTTLKPEWVRQAAAGMLFHDWLLNEKKHAEHHVVHWHPA